MVGVFACLGLSSELIEHLPGSLHHRCRHSRQPCGFDAVAAAGAPRAHLVEEEQVVAGFFHQHLKIGHVLAFASLGIELVIVGGEHAAALQLSGQMFTHGPGDG